MTLPEMFLAGRYGCWLPLVRDPLAVDHRPRFFPHPILWTSVLQPLANAGLGLIVARFALVTDGIAAGIVNSPALAAIVVISYSLYLWQMLFINPGGHPLLTFPLNVVSALAAAGVSYTLIEYPFNVLRGRGRSPVYGSSALMPAGAME